MALDTQACEDVLGLTPIDNLDEALKKFHSAAQDEIKGTDVVGEKSLFIKYHYSSISLVIAIIGHRYHWSSISLVINIIGCHNHWSSISLTIFFFFVCLI